MAKTSLLQERVVYKPFEYPQASEYWLKATTSTLAPYRSTYDVRCK